MVFVWMAPGKGDCHFSYGPFSAFQLSLLLDKVLIIIFLHSPIAEIRPRELMRTILSLMMLDCVLRRK